MITIRFTTAYYEFRRLGEAEPVVVSLRNLWIRDVLREIFSVQLVFPSQAAGLDLQNLREMTPPAAT